MFCAVIYETASFKLKYFNLFKLNKPKVDLSNGRVKFKRPIIQNPATKCRRSDCPHLPNLAKV